jgi:N utilization substance protein B
MRSARTASRHRSRQAALQVLYAAELGPGTDDPAAAAQRAFEALAEHFELPEGARAYAKELVLGVASRRAELDDALRVVAQHWRLERMAAVDRNVLRLGAFELLHGDAPPEVVLDEAVELARRFGGEQSPRFVNGILDAMARRIRASGRAAGEGGTSP